MISIAITAINLIAISAFRKVSKPGKPPKVNQEHFHQHFKLPEHNGIDHWRVTLTDRANNRKELRRRESFGSVNQTHSFLTSWTKGTY